MPYPRGSQEWKDEFARRREAVVESLRSAVASSSDVVCRPCSGAFTFGWQFEQGHTGHPTQVEVVWITRSALTTNRHESGFLQEQTEITEKTWE